MELDPDACYRALRARDTRFDGVFFVGVATTGIYCRPVCPARTPRRDRCSFFGGSAQAERAGFRACLRCRPERAPGLSSVDSAPHLVRSAATRIEAGFLNDHSVDALASELGVTGRHLRRTMEAQLGVSPIELAQTHRLALAKQLLHETTLPLTTIALAAGFGSVRRFNAVFRRHFDRPPSAIRASRPASKTPKDRPHGFVVRLGFRPPFDYAAHLRFLDARAIPGLEQVSGDRYLRSITLGAHEGWILVTPQRGHNALEVTVALSLGAVLPEVVARVRRLFDLDARPDVIADHLADDPILEPGFVARPGLRVPGAFDPFEVAIRAVLGQQVSVRGATTLSGRLVQRFGQPLSSSIESITHRFPAAQLLAAQPASAIAEIGLPQARAHAIVELSSAVAEDRVDLDPTASPRETIEQLRALPGIGPWTAHYVAMRALDWPDAFPASDLWVRKGLHVKTARQAEQRAHAWSPWRAYGVMHLWNLDP